MEDKLQQLLNAQLRDANVHSAVLAVESQDSKFSWKSAGGIANPSTDDLMLTESEFFVASVTKMFTGAIMMQLVVEKLVDLEESITDYLPASLTDCLHTLNDIDHTAKIKVKDLLQNTSGLPDYFSGKQENGKTMLEILIEDGDRSWGVKEAVEISKKFQRPLFVPGKHGKAHYSDTNFQLLRSIIENTTGQSIFEVVQQRISRKINLHSTYMFNGEGSPALFYYKDQLLQIPKALSSVTTDGGIVSTAPELIKFLKSYFAGELFPQKLLEDMQHWNRIFFPLQYGTALMRFKLPRIFSPFAPVPEMIGHSGVTGSFAYYVAEKKLYIAGTLNQIYPNNRPYKLLVQVANLF